MNLEQMEAKIKALADRVKDLEYLDDMEQIKTLQRTYGYYYEYGMWNELIELFSDDAESIEIGGSGVYVGKEGIRRLWGNREKVPPQWLHLLIQLSPVIHIDPDGKAAEGRWYGLLFLALPDNEKSGSTIGLGTYENKYTKEGGKWKFKKVRFYWTFHSPWEDGWVKTPFLSVYPKNQLPPDLPSTGHDPYPSGFSVPFHYVHPVTGRKVGGRPAVNH